VQDNVGIGRPEEVSLVFARHLRRPTRHPYQTRIFSAGTEVRIDFRYKHSRVKQYLKDGRADHPPLAPPAVPLKPPHRA
jgi:hypothetical protein